jgi:ribonuclease BN (tRNA processing enzyme)
LKPQNLVLTFLGSGSAFTVGSGNYHSNMLLSCNNSNLLIDCGSDARLSLYELGYGFDDINDVYISHLHADHAGGLEWLGFTRMFTSKLQKPVLHINYKLVKKLWENVLSGGMSSLIHRPATLEDYFTLDIIGDEERFIWQGYQIDLIRTIHYEHDHHLNPSYGLMISGKTTKTFITTDTQFHPEVYMKSYLAADLIFHDCELSPRAAVHPPYPMLVTLPKEIKEKMWLYHYNGNQLPDAKADGFRGFVKKGQHFVLK